MYFTAKELAGVAGMPNLERNCLTKLNKFMEQEGIEPSLKRRREGSKANEYHISILPLVTQTALYKREGKIKVGDLVLELPKRKASKVTVAKRFGTVGTKPTTKRKIRLSNPSKLFKPSSR